MHVCHVCMYMATTASRSGRLEGAWRGALCPCPCVRRRCCLLVGVSVERAPEWVPRLSFHMQCAKHMLDRSGLGQAGQHASMSAQYMQVFAMVAVVCMVPRRHACRRIAACSVSPDLTQVGMSVDPRCVGNRVGHEVYGRAYL